MFADYVKKLSAVKKLRPDEERALWRAYKEKGDEGARRRIIEAYQPLVFREVMPYRALPAVMDAVQEGTIGLIEAVERYDPARGVAFSLYAELAEHHALVGVLGDAMARLPLQERRVLEGVTIGGTGAQTMAQMLDVTPAHIYRLQQSGIRRIRGMLSRFMQYW